MITKTVLYFVLSALSVLATSAPGFARAEGPLKWWDPAASAFPVLEGQGWPKEVQAPYDRLPARAEALVRKPVWTLSRNATGLIVRFRTTAKTITINYTVKGKLNAPHNDLGLTHSADAFERVFRSALEPPAGNP